MMRKELLSTPIPPRLAARPRDRRGFPIPYGTLCADDGTPDFRVTDIERWIDAVNRRLCGLCGCTLGRRLAFVGGTRSHESRTFTDLPMHRECAEYALRVCPYLAMPNMTHAQKVTAQAEFLLASAFVTSERPERFALGITTGFDVLQHGVEYLLRAQPWLESVWWKDGAPLEAGSL